MAMTFTNTHNMVGQHSTIKPKLIFAAISVGYHHLEPITSTILAVMNVHGQQKAIWRSRTIDTGTGDSECT